MPMLPEEISTATVRRHWWRGYHPGQIDTLLAQVATDYTGAIDRIAHEATQPPETLAQARREAHDEAVALRTRAEHAVIRHAEHAATALTQHATELRTQAQTDTDAARRRLEQADTHARHLEDTARQHWDALRSETEQRWTTLLTAEHRLNDRIHQLERTLRTLRTRLSLLDQLTEVDDALANIRSETQPLGSQR